MAADVSASPQLLQSQQRKQERKIHLSIPRHRRIRLLSPEAAVKRASLLPYQLFSCPLGISERCIVGEVAEDAGAEVLEVYEGLAEAV